MAKRLGRGLEALLNRIGSSDQETEFYQEPGVSALGLPHEDIFSGVNDPGANAPASLTSNFVDITLIEPNPFQPRKEFDEEELEQLAQSLMTHGLLQPIVVRSVEDRYQIIAGERRFRAAIRAGWNEVPVHCLSVDDRQMIELAITENLQRKDLNAIEKATSFANYLQTYGGTHEELAKRLELDRSTVTNLLRLLDLPQVLQEAVLKEKLTQGHVRALLRLEEEFEQIEIAAKIQAEGWSVRETENFVKELVETGQATDPKNTGWNVIGHDGQTRSVTKQSEQVLQLEQDFRSRLGGLNVKLTQTNGKGKGKLVISFANHAEFEMIYTAICRGNKAAG